jgi:hypothetical protein
MGPAALVLSHRVLSGCGSCLEVLGIVLEQGVEVARWERSMEWLRSLSHWMVRWRDWSV